jgi:hypothetical protein
VASSIVIQAYFAYIKSVLDRYAAASFVLDSAVSFETRPGNQGYLHGVIVFIDESRLFFREYLDVSVEQLDKLTYTYHYQDAEDNLLFRYDNAPHKPALPFVDHKHIAPDGIVQADAPALADVLVEIATRQGWI